MSATTECSDTSPELETWVQWAVPNPVPELSDELIQYWADKTYLAACERADLPVTNEVSIRISDKNEVQALNCNYRDKDKPTNVLSFPADVPQEVEVNLLGDIVICLDVVSDEAQEANKTIADHFAHMVVHGVLHLCGYDHINDTDAEEMEALEVSILKDLQIANPYQS